MALLIGGGIEGRTNLISALMPLLVSTLVDL